MRVYISFPATELYAEKNVKTILEGRNIYISWPTPAAVVGFKVRIKSSDGSTPFQSIYGIPNYFSYSAMITEDPNWRVAYTGKLDVDMTNYANITNVNATFAIEVGGANIIDDGSVTLYHLNEYVDDCEVPDSSLHSTSSSSEDNFGTRSSMTCNKGFKHSIGYVTCPKNGDWKSYEDVVNCEPTTCKELTVVGIEYRPDLVGKLAAYGTKAYYKCKNYDGEELGDGHNYVECIEAGDWQGKLEQCGGQTWAFVARHSSSILALASGVVILIVVVIYLLIRRKNRQTARIAAIMTPKYVAGDYENPYEDVDIEMNLRNSYCLPTIDDYDDCGQQTLNSNSRNTMGNNYRSYIEMSPQ